MSKLVSIVKNLPFFKDRGLKDAAISDTLGLMTYKEVNKDDFVIEYGTFGDEFYLILEGECEVLVPQRKDGILNIVNFELRSLKEKVKQHVKEIIAYEAY